MPLLQEGGGGVKKAEYEDPNHDGNSSRYWTGQTCDEPNCNHPAGTAWSPHWCVKHNAERMRRIDNIFASVGKKESDK